jgi:hypothetical protein
LHKGVAARPLEWKYVFELYSKITAKAFSQHAARAVQPCFHSFFAYSKQHCGSFVLISSTSRNTKTMRNAAGSLSTSSSSISRIWAWAAARSGSPRVVSEDFLRSMQHVEIEHGTPASLASNCLIQNNAGEPGSQAGSRAKISQASEDPHVGFLHGIFGFLIVQQHAARNAVQVLVVASD